MSDTKISCPHCLQHISLDSAWAGQTLNCPVCQKPFTVPQFAPGTHVSPAPGSVPPTGGLRLNTSSAVSSQTFTPTSSGPGVAPASRSTQTSGLAIASIVLSLLGCFFVTAIAGVICGHLARSRIRNNASLSGGGLAIAGLTIGYLMIALCLGGTVKFCIDVKNRVDEIQAQRNGQSAPTSAPTPPSYTGPVGAKIRSFIPAPADAVSGTIKGEPFKYTRSSLFQSGGPFEIDGREFATEGFLITIFFNQKPGESLEGRTWHITPTTAPGSVPTIFIVKMHAGSSTKDRINSGYEMDLTTGEVSGGVKTQIRGVSRTMGGRIAGTITLKINGAVPVDVHGNFTASFD